MMNAKTAALTSYKNSKQLAKIVAETKEKISKIIEDAAMEGFFNVDIDFSWMEDKPWRLPLTRVIEESLKEKGYHVNNVIWTLQVSWKNTTLNEEDIIKKMWEEIDESD